jgi:hypothetical protein
MSQNDIECAQNEVLSAPEIADNDYGIACCVKKLTFVFGVS